ncbi:MAG: DUF1553 domain-containing protein [Saprospiraceae bacterium]
MPKQLDYNFHIKPILSDRCFSCHGPDAKHQEGGLRLDHQEGATASLKSGAGQAIVPGHPDRSVLLKRVLSHDPEVMMPPPASNLSLSPREIAMLQRWIAEGAVYKPHWAFIKPERPEVPKVEGDWARNPIDHFIQARLSQEGLQPSGPADESTLLRRVFFDLTGLPPMAADIKAYLADQRPDKYEKLVDSLLRLPAYGERMAAHWMDVARYSDSEGYLDDYHHAMWPYRDWVIKAFNENLSYADFILWQVGGDQMPNASQEQILATAFNRQHKHNSEGGIIPEEFRVEYNVDRTHTVGTAFMGLTMGCARCHDHKYDPISQENFYELYAFFNSTIERGDGIFSTNAVERAEPVDNFHAMNPGPVLPLPNEEVAAIRTFLQKEIKEKEAEVERLERSRQTAFDAWKKNAYPSHDFEKTILTKALVQLPFDEVQDNKTPNLASQDHPGKMGGLTLVAGKSGQAIQSDAAGFFSLPGLPLDFERTEPFAISFWVYTPKHFEDSHVLWNGNRRIQGYRGWDVVLEDGKLAFRINHAHPFQSLHRQTIAPLPLNTWTHFCWTYDGSSRAEGIQLYLNGEPTNSHVVRDYLYRSARPYKQLEEMVYGNYDQLSIGNRHYDEDFTGGRIDELQVFKGLLSPLEALYTFDKQAALAQFAKGEDQQALLTYFQYNFDEVFQQTQEQLHELRQKELVTIDTVREIMVMGDWPEERPTYILNRGLYDAPTTQVSRNVPADIFPFPEDYPKNRYGLGKWLIHQDHPLTARVAVNQLWYLMFGRGIVATNEDFGNQGALPTHPALLDWLAVDFRENGWDVKRLIRMMVTSATYRQSSKVTPEMLEIDPNNELLAHSPRYRRSAEMIRDNALAASGLLKKIIGGRSTFPYQPAGLWIELTKKPYFVPYAVDPIHGIHRRSLYTFWKRNLPPPSMLIFDAVTRSECQLRRQQSNTPLQALVMLNDPQIIEACRVLSENIWRSTKAPETALSNAFESLIGRPPTAKEKTILEQYYQAEYERFATTPADALAYLSTGFVPADPSLSSTQVAALARVANTIMNSTEGHYKN